MGRSPWSAGASWGSPLVSLRSQDKTQSRWKEGQGLWDSLTLDPEACVPADNRPGEEGGDSSVSATLRAKVPSTHSSSAPPLSFTGLD